MEKNLILTANDCTRNEVKDINATAAIIGVFQKVSKTLKTPVELLRKYYSSVLEKEISLHQTWLLTEAQLAFVLGIFPADYNLLLRGVFAGWFLWSIKKCRKSGI